MNTSPHIRIPGLLIVSGTGRDSGKTTLVCQLIERLSKTHNITAIKVSPHFHPMVSDSLVIAHTDRYQIIRETDPTQAKDSSRMLKAGARQVFYIQCGDENLATAFSALETVLSPDDMYICESGGLRQFYIPDMFIIVHNREKTYIKEKAQHLMPLTDLIINRSGNAFDYDLKKISIHGNQWVLV